MPLYKLACCLCKQGSSCALNLLKFCWRVTFLSSRTERADRESSTGPASKANTAIAEEPENGKISYHTGYACSPCSIMPVCFLGLVSAASGRAAQLLDNCCLGLSILQRCNQQYLVACRDAWRPRN